MSYVHELFQVASQQGVYLAKCFNRMEECEKNPEGPLRFRGEGRHRFHPFRYKLDLSDHFASSLYGIMFLTPTRVKWDKVITILLMVSCSILIFETSMNP